MLPAVRAALSVIMVNELGSSLYDAAKSLGITPAAVSNYISGKRGSELASVLLSSNEFREELEELAKRLISREATLDDIIEFVCGICKDARMNKPLPKKLKSEYQRILKVK